MILPFFFINLLIINIKSTEFSSMCNYSFVDYREGVCLAYKVGRCLLRERLIEADMTQVELAIALGVRVQQINKYVLDKQKMSLQVAYNIAVILNCRIDDLYDWIEVGFNE